MTESVVTATAASSVREVAELMRERNVGSVVLVAGDAPVGVVTDRDLTVSVLADDRGASDRAEDHASAPVVTATAGMDVRASAWPVAGLAQTSSCVPPTQTTPPL